MRITYIKLVNFIGVDRAMGLRSFEFSFTDITKRIIQIYGPNRCGKTVLLQQLHPFSSINLNGDERSDLSLILPNEIGIKNIVYEMNGEVYNITHTYKPTPSGNHTVSSSIMHDGEELNPSGGVNLFNTIIENILGINKYVFQFIINGTQLTSFANMSYTQRKTLMNKAMGIDIYDKIHKLATDDYRYTSKLITSLSNTKEYLLTTYGSYESLMAVLSQTREKKDHLTKQIFETKSRLDELTGKIRVLQDQNVHGELDELNRTFATYENTVKILGDVNAKTYDQLVENHIELNNKLNTLRNERNLLNKDLDILYEKRDNLQSTMMMAQKSKSDYDEMVAFRDTLKNKIDAIVIEEHVSSSSEYLNSMISLGQAINSICKEIVTCLNEKHLKMFAEMIDKGVDVSAFLIREGATLMDSEKEKNTISRIRTMINSVDGEYVNDCVHGECIYKRSHEMLETYFKSYQSTSEHAFTQYDMDQFDHAWKNVQTIKRLIHTEFSDEVKPYFDIRNIIMSLTCGEYGVPIKRLQYLMEEAAKTEQRIRYISQLDSTEKTIETMKQTMLNYSDQSDDVLNQIQDQIKSIQDKMQTIGIEERSISDQISSNDQYRMMLSQIKDINIDQLQKRRNKLLVTVNELSNAISEHGTLNSAYTELTNELNLVQRDLEALETSNTQYQNTIRDIKAQMENDKRYKIIAEATSSTKGKPVLAIREKMEEALVLANRLLDVMYHGDIRLTKPTIDETTFALPFRCGCNQSVDIRYGSQSEVTILSLALSLALASGLSTYQIMLLDEEDAYMDAVMSDAFVLMLTEIMSTVKMDQLFIISHKMQPGMYDQTVHVLHLSDEIEKLK